MKLLVQKNQIWYKSVDHIKNGVFVITLPVDFVRQHTTGG